MWETIDPAGREVVLDWAGWSHVLRRHPYIGVEREVLLETVARPDARSPGPQPNEEWFYRRGAGPSAWIRVVVHYEGNHGLIVTAFPRRSFP
jgi:hypothetical protein